MALERQQLVLKSNGTADRPTAHSFPVLARQLLGQRSGRELFLSIQK